MVMDTLMFRFYFWASHRHSLMLELGCNFNTTLQSRLDLTLMHIHISLASKMNVYITILICANEYTCLHKKDKLSVSFINEL